MATTEVLSLRAGVTADLFRRTCAVRHQILATILGYLHIPDRNTRQRSSRYRSGMAGVVAALHPVHVRSSNSQVGELLRPHSLRKLASRHKRMETRIGDETKG
jgi:hypothetical protein